MLVSGYFRAKILSRGTNKKPVDCNGSSARASLAHQAESQKRRYVGYGRVLQEVVGEMEGGGSKHRYLWIISSAFTASQSLFYSGKTAIAINQQETAV